MGNRRSRGLAAGTILLGALLLLPDTQAGDVGLVDGLWVMKKVEDRYEGDDVQEDLHLTLSRTDRKEERLKTMDVVWLEKDYGKDKRLVVSFVNPEFFRGTTLLMVVKPYVDDDRNLYLPMQNVIKNVVAKDQYSNFMGTDFTYFDLSEREPDEEVHKLLRIESFQGAPCYVVETRGKDPADSPYSRRLTWVDKDRFLKLRIQYWNRAGEFQKQYDPSGWQRIDGIWTALTLRMEDYLAAHATVIKRSRVRYNGGIADAYFLVQNIDCVTYKDGVLGLIPFEKRPTRVWAEKRKMPPK